MGIAFLAVRAIMTPTALSLLLVVGPRWEIQVLRGTSPHVLAGVLTFGCAALLHLVTGELLVETHDAAETLVASTMFFAGFLALLLLGIME
jgi:zinc transporter, ZIP family